MSEPRRPPRLLRENVPFRNLWLGRTVSIIASNFVRIALTLLIFERTGSGTAVGAFLLAQTVPFFFGPLLGTVVDRVEQRRLMVLSQIGQALLFVVIALVDLPFVGLLALVVTGAFLSALFMPAGRSALPQFVSKGELQDANALLAAGLNTALAAGPAGAGLMAAFVGPQQTLLAPFVLYLVAALLFRQLPTVPPQASDGPPKGFFAATGDGLRMLRDNGVAKGVAVGLLFGVLFASLDNVASVFLAREVLDGTEFEFGLKNSVYGIGMVVAPLLLLRIAKVPARTIFLVGFALSGLGNILTGVAPIIWFAIAAQAFPGAGNGLANVATDTLIQTNVPREHLGRVFGTVYSLPFVAEGIAYSLGGVLLDLTGAREVYIISGIGVLCATVVMARVIPKVGVQIDDG